MNLQAADSPEANGRRPKSGEIKWTLIIPLDTGDKLYLTVGQQSRDILFGMMIADCKDSGEAEPATDCESILAACALRGQWIDTDCDNVRLDGEFTVQELQAVIQVMRNKS